MNKLNILFLSDVSSVSFVQKLNDEFTVFYRVEDLKYEEFFKIDIIWSHLGFKIDCEFICKFPNVKYVICPVTGINHIDVDYINSLKIRLITLRGEQAFLSKVSATAEHTWAIFLALQKNVINAHFSITKLQYFNRNIFDSSQLAGKSVGIVGCGRIGKMIAKYALSFNMKVYFYDIKIIKTSKRFTFLNLSQLLMVSDYVFLTASYSKEFHYFFDINMFKLMKKSSVFINTSRGELVNEKDLIYSLSNNIIAGAALDVFDNELNFDTNTNELVKYATDNSNLILTPHIGGRSTDALDLVENYLLNKLKKIIN